MPTVERYDITGLHPEKAELEKKLAEIRRELTHMRSFLSQEGRYRDGGKNFLEQNRYEEESSLRRRIGELESDETALLNELFRIDPTEEH